MRLEDDTEYAICAAMGVGTFAAVDAILTIRLLLMPSFDPEVCVTVTPSRIEVVALGSMFKREPATGGLPKLTESAAISNEQYDAAVAFFSHAVAEHAVKAKMMTLDGMLVSAFYKSDEGRASFAGHPDGPLEAAFVVYMLEIAHSSMSGAPLKNSIARCGRYLDRLFAVETEPELQQMTNILIVGTPEERAAYFEQLPKKA